MATRTLMKVYTYKDNKSEDKKSWQIEAEDILQADKAFEVLTGLNPVKTPWIGVTISRPVLDRAS